ncbi:MAG: hypothetical protein ACR2FY_15455 [Pirellulaceae bacterium]
MSSIADGKPDNLHAAIAGGDSAEIARYMLAQDFTLVEEYDDEVLEENVGAMILEVDGFPALVAFTSEECAGNFVDTTPDLVGSSGTMPGFVVGGDSVFEYLPEGYGLILNPETEVECHVLPPDLAAQIKRCITGGAHSSEARSQLGTF